MTTRKETAQKRQVVARALREHHKALASFVCARAAAADVEDVLQTAALRALEKAESLGDPTRVLPWLYRLHRHVAVDVVRGRARQQLLVDKVQSASGDSQETGLLSGLISSATLKTSQPSGTSESPCGCIVAQARNMGPSYAPILGLVDIGGATLAEAAQALGVSINNATVRLHRARRALKNRMLDHCGVRSLRECFDCLCTTEGCCPV